MTAGLDRWVLAAAGWAGIVALVVCVDTEAVRTGRATMSSGFGTAGRNPIAGPFVVGAWCGLCYHLTTELRRR